MTQSQNEKDREWLNYVDEHLIKKSNISPENFVLFEVWRLADRFLAELENAETVYKIHDKKRSVTHYFKNVSHLYNDEFTQEKGVWIPVEEAE
ncbi:hypothetical protein HB884_05960 [Listeria booriae]|uniref:hypothetical protein n=1 Tax=Listeria booriae TaxID=1552123 RepID=UPI001625C81C|nr:hypothetical protein [Listeria booriae]MBC1523750.1 hypothetical protein [Listeria booriae]